MRFVTISTLYPSSVDPKHGIFVETRLRKYLENYPDSKVKVIAPVPWFPFKGERFGEYGRYAHVPKVESWNGLEVHHPRYWVIPKIGMLLTPIFLAISIALCLRKVLKGFSPNFIDGHYFYPDGVAISWVASWFKLPFYLTARGTDLNLIPEYPLPRKMIQKAAKRTTHSITVCEALRTVLIDMGEPGDQVSTLRNGVDLKLFSQPSEREALREKLGVSGKVLISVGHLVERKGHYLVIDAMAKLPNEFNLLIAGEGADLGRLQEQVKQKGLEQRVRFLGALRQKELAKYYGVADALILASSREGWANVLLESMACGTPVVATEIWGTPEIVQSKEAGVLVKRTADSIAEGVSTLFTALPVRQETRSYAEQFSWDETVHRMHALFQLALGEQN